VRGPVLTGKAILESTRGHLALGLQHHRHRLPLAPVLSQVPEEDSILRLAPVDPLQFPLRPSSSVRLLGGDYLVGVLSQPPVADTALLPVPVSSDSTPRPRRALFCPRQRGQVTVDRAQRLQGCFATESTGTGDTTIQQGGSDAIPPCCGRVGSSTRLISIGRASGARWGELNGLFWGDLHLDRRVMFIQRALMRG
jgi:hypothetical protein